MDNLKKLILLFYILTLPVTFSAVGSENDHSAISNDSDAIDYSDSRLKKITKILRTHQQEASPSCIESLKKLYKAKEAYKLFKANPAATSANIQQDINNSILRALYTNAVELCEVDAKEVCLHQTPKSIKKECMELTYH